MSQHGSPLKSLETEELKSFLFMFQSLAKRLWFCCFILNTFTSKDLQSLWTPVGLVLGQLFFELHILTLFGNTALLSYGIQHPPPPPPGEVSMGLIYLELQDGSALPRSHRTASPCPRREWLLEWEEVICHVYLFLLRLISLCCSSQNSSLLKKKLNNSFIEIHFTYHTTHLFEVYDSMRFSILKELCKLHHH